MLQVKAMADSQAGPDAGTVDLRIDRPQQRAFLNGQALVLTATEFRLLDCLSAEPGRPFSRAGLTQVVIAGGAVVLERTIDQHVCALRRKLRPFELIETVRNVGYRWHGPRPAALAHQP
jgi:DNA-binding response OmpR family regulator